MFTNAGMVQFKDVFVGKETRPYRAGHLEPEVHPHLRQAQRPRERRRHRAAPHVLRDARQLLVRRLLQGRGDRLRLGAPDEGPRARPGANDDHRLRRRGRRRGRTTKRASLWKKVTGLGRRAHRRPRDDGQLLADGRDRPLRPVHRDPLVQRRRAPASVPYGTFGDEPHARRPRVDGDLEPRLHAVRALHRRRRATRV